MLDDNWAHLDQSVRKKILARGYIPIYFGGGIMGDVAPKPKPKPSSRPGRGKPKPPAMASMAPINHHFPPLPESPPLPPGFILPPDRFALFYQGQVQDENSAKRPRLM